MASNEKGFTLIEMCIVLFIFSVLLIVSSSIVIKQKQSKLYEPFEQQIQLLVFEAYSLAQKVDSTRVYCMPEKMILSYGLAQGHIREIVVPSSYIFGCDFNRKTHIEFNYAGHIPSGVNLNPGTIYFKEENRDAIFDYTVNFSYGRMRKK